jgi:hypothetical protein
MKAWQRCCRAFLSCIVPLLVETPTKTLISLVLAFEPKGGREQACFFLDGYRRLGGGILYKPLLTYKLARHA